MFIINNHQKSHISQIKKFRAESAESLTFQSICIAHLHTTQHNALIMIIIITTRPVVLITGGDKGLPFPCSFWRRVIMTRQCKRRENGGDNASVFFRLQRSRMIGPKNKNTHKHRDVPDPNTRRGKPGRRAIRGERDRREQTRVTVVIVLSRTPTHATLHYCWSWIRHFVSYFNSSIRVLSPFLVWRSFIQSRTRKQQANPFRVSLFWPLLGCGKNRVADPPPIACKSLHFLVCCWGMVCLVLSCDFFSIAWLVFQAKIHQRGVSSFSTCCAVSHVLRQLLRKLQARSKLHCYMHWPFTVLVPFSCHLGKRLFAASPVFTEEERISLAFFTSSCTERNANTKNCKLMMMRIPRIEF